MCLAVIIQSGTGGFTMYGKRIARAVMIGWLGEIVFVIIFGDLGILFTVALTYILLKHCQ